MANEFDKIKTVQDLLLVNEVTSAKKEKASKADQTVMYLLQKNEPKFILEVAMKLSVALQHYHIDITNSLIDDNEAGCAAHWAADAAKLENVVITLSDITL